MKTGGFKKFKKLEITNARRVLNNFTEVSFKYNVPKLEIKMQVL